jgi:large subunit ribosomal protein L19e
MELQKRLAAEVLNCSPKRVRFDPEHLTQIREAITKFDIGTLVNKGFISKVQKQGISRARAKKLQIQRRKGRKTGHGSRKGLASARLNPKMVWIERARAQRGLTKRLRAKGLITNESFKTIYAKIKGGFFRSTHHIKIYIEEQDMIIKKGKHGNK